MPAVLTALGEPGNLLKLADTHVGVENLDALSIENAATSPADGLGASVVATSGDAVAGAGAIVALARIDRQHVDHGRTQRQQSWRGDRRGEL